ncbi:MAG TPA: GNAT family protein [Burkholderiaceae bacterium]|jgi:RimJ/RimL family protein N-acetyltransferase
MTNTFSAISLSTERLTLRPLWEADAQSVYAIRSDPQVMRYHSSAPWTSINPAIALIARDTAAMASGEYLRLGLTIVGNTTLIGSCCLFDLDRENRRGEIGYELHRSYWGRGYMHEALQALLDFAFSTMLLNRIEADIHPDNLASARTLERLGFQREGFLRERWIVDGEISDTVLYGLLQREWASRRR